MSYGSDITSLKAEYYAVGLSATIGVTVSPGQVASALRIISGGTLYIGGMTNQLGSSGFLLDTNIFSLDCRGTFYLSATSATVTVCVLKGRTSGYE